MFVGVGDREDWVWGGGGGGRQAYKQESDKETAIPAPPSLSLYYSSPCSALVGISSFIFRYR